MKDLYIQILAKSKTTNNSNSNNNLPANVTIVDASHYDSKELKDLKDTLRQRDNEISILVNMLKKEKKKFTDIANGKPPVYALQSGDSPSDDIPKEFTKHHSKRQICKLDY